MEAGGSVCCGLTLMGGSGLPFAGSWLGGASGASFGCGGGMIGRGTGGETV